MADLDLCDSKVVEGVVVDSSIFLHDRTYQHRRRIDDYPG